ncbi:GlmU family protein [Desertivirga arenae]|uniref:GlmU family protein n=1 Tax=Desertivirga arenae TaxID=2810309 RepID=UPI001A95CBDA|nr:GlmU family protein [Pedobacter sp. SYSU D00823]
MNIVLFDDSTRESLLPLTFTRPVASLRIGILTIAEKWEKYLNAEASYLTADYLSVKFPFKPSDNSIFINGSVCPNPLLLEAIDKLGKGEALVQKDVLIAVKGVGKDFFTSKQHVEQKEFTGSFTRIVYPEHIFSYNHAEIVLDFKLLTQGRTSAQLSSTNTVLGENIFVEEGVSAECAIFNTTTGPIYLGKNSTVLEGSVIRGSFSLGEHALVKLAAKIYGKTTVGPYCKVGGEINNAVLYENSSKGHDGYLGNSVLGEWCNIGADSNNSNLKNNYAEVKLWDYNKERFRKTGLQFCGLIMGDHSKCGINTMFNTGTVVGVSANIFGAGFPRNFIPDFSWGGAQGYEVYAINKVFETAERVYERRDSNFDSVEKEILQNVFELTKQYRNF